jgi:hypothetical protein
MKGESFRCSVFVRKTLAAQFCFDGLPFRRRLVLVCGLIFSPIAERFGRGGKSTLFQ